MGFENQKSFNLTKKVRKIPFMHPLNALPAKEYGDMALRTHLGEPRHIRNLHDARCGPGGAPMLLLL